MGGFVYPNEGLVEWDLLIAVYPYITGLVAGAFIVSSLYHVFGLTRFAPVARFSLLTALAFLLVTPLPLVVHLGRPERAAEMFLTPNLTSAMSAFGYIWLFYLLLVLTETWLVFRPDIVGYANSASEGAKKTFYSILALGIYEVSPESQPLDKKVIKVLAFVGIPSAFLLHGYVGFIFGAVKANPWWSTPLMPIIFLMSATVSGVALLIMLYIVITKIRKMPIDQNCLRSLGLWLGGFLSANVVLEALEVFNMYYEAEESWGIVYQLITQKITLSYLGIQFVFGALLPLGILGYVALGRLGEQLKVFLSLVSSLLVLIGVFAMRWNVVIGGQLISKSERGFIEFAPPLLGINGIATAAALLLLPFLILVVIIYFIPPWQEAAKLPQRKRLSFGSQSFK